VQAAGNVSVTAFDGLLVPVALSAATENVYVPGGTAGKLNESPAGTLIVVVMLPVTWIAKPVVAKPPTGGVQESAR
jgi:hypothetical protein